MKFHFHNKLILFAFAGSITVHLIALGAFAHISISSHRKDAINLDNLKVIDVEQADINQDSIPSDANPQESPKNPVAKDLSTIPASKELPAPRVNPLNLRKFSSQENRVEQVFKNTTTGPKRTGSIGGNPGGFLNLGSGSTRGDLSGAPTGNTPVGSVPSSAGGSGSGSGNGPGIGKPEPVPEAHGEGHQTAVETPPASPKHESPLPEKKKEPAEEHHNRIADRSMPEAISEPSPVYPSSAQDEGIEGTVRVKYVVNTSGTVEDEKVVQSSGHRILDDAALSAVRKYRYKPAVQDGIPRDVTMTCRIVFRLE